ncbi:unnamed protein product [Plutella xylostella]|uniref:V-type proton ATPase subunit a n=1 Tax=Plutella xylostella TaxID=51655 RepID=A0A8S4GAR0_PLUXY|nr:unnamed protein product [Plutella xylostella]
MFRSAKMTLCNIYVQPQAAFLTLSRLGDMGCVEFLDSNSSVQAFQRKYVPELCRCEELERKLRLMEAELKKDGIAIAPLQLNPKPVQQQDMIAFENLLEEWTTDIEEMTTNNQTLLKNYLELSEMLYVLTTLSPIFGSADLERDPRYAKATGSRPESKSGLTGHLVVVTGVVRRARSHAFETMLWRISHGNLFYRVAAEDKTLVDPATDQQIRKVAFIIICHGDELGNRVKKICTGFKANLYNCPTTQEEREEMIYKLQVRLDDIEQVMKKTKYHRCKALRSVGRQFSPWMASTKKSKAIYHTMNLFSLDITKECLIGQCWVPTDQLKAVQDVLEATSKESGAEVESFISVATTTDAPPTFYRTNKFTNAFQLLINAYGDATYRELNPGLYTVITFPFLFAMMFGDIGHGLLMLLFGVWMVYHEKKFIAERSDNEIWNIFFGGRYVILLMGAFSIYTGFIYNDCFGKNLSLQNSMWKNPHSLEVLMGPQKTNFLDAFGKGPNRTAPPKTYWFGRDPAWSMAKNKMVFENSLKMKLSIVVGVMHMVFGIILSFFNHMHFRHTHAIFLEFLPQIIFLNCLFMYLVFMMFFKWFTYSMYSDTHETREHCAPLLLIYFIDMVLFRDTKPVEEDCNAYMFANQPYIQKCLVLVSLVCVPIMLFGSPVWVSRVNAKKRAGLRFQKKHFKGTHGVLAHRRFRHSDAFAETDQTKELTELENMERKYRELHAKMEAEVAAKYPGFGELMITQSVHTIEFVLSTVSHTASYLRLWALSLAHAQLSEMLWDMVFDVVNMDRNYNLNLRWEMLILAVRVDRGQRELKERRRNRAFIRRNVDPFVSSPDSEFLKTFRLSKDVVKVIAADLTPR